MRRVGKHSARGSQEDRDPGSAEADSGPGAGRRRRSAAPGAQDPAATPPQGMPRTALGAAPPPARS
ncbi:hypothetical protein EEJ42_35195, partial [Streptomyces botrytidirepellens]